MSEWKKVKIGDICKIVKGTTGIASAEPGQYPLVVTAEERKTCSTYQFDCEAVCIPLVSSSGHGKKSLKNVHYQSGKFALGTILCAVIPNNPQELDARYLHQYLQFYKDIVLVPLMKGAANVSLSMKDIATVEFPLPPIERQRELSNLFVTLQEKQKELSAEYEKQTEYAKLLRQNILQQAIEGKLTADWRNQNPVQKGNPDYDAEALFEQIQKERSKEKKQKELSPISDEEKPFEIPEGWKWVRFGSVIDITTNIVNSSDYKNMIQVSPDDIEKNTGRLIYPLRTVKEKEIISVNHLFSKDMLIYSKIRPRLRKIVYVDFDGLCSADMYPLKTSLKYAFVKQLMLSDYFDLEVYKFDNRVKMPKINQPQLNSIKIPIPPLEEQSEIVRLVETNLTKISKIESQIQEREIYTKQLMQSILKDAFEEN